MLTSRSTQRAHPLVHALVAAAHQGEARQRCQLAGQRIGQSLAGGVQEQDRDALRANRGEGRRQWLGAQDHARSPAIRGVVHLAVAPEAMLSQVVQRNRHDPALHGAAQDALGQGRTEEVREQGDDVDSQAWRWRS